MKTRFYFALIILFSFVWVNSSLADPRMWGPSGVPVRHGMYLSWDRSVAQNSMGYSLAVWSDARTGGRDIYAQLIAPTGEPQWEPQGIAVIQEPHVQWNPAVCSVSDGWIVAWFDQRGSEDSNRAGVWAQKLDINGNRVWVDADLNGIYLGTSCRWSYTPRVDLFDDNLGGASAVWTNKSNLSDQFYHTCFQHVNANGVVALATPLVASAPSLNFSVSTGDGLGNVIVVWSERNAGDFDVLRSQKISQAGLMLWNPLGAVVDSTSTHFIVYRLAAASDGQGGYYLAWQTTLGEEALAASKVTHLNADGSNLWDPDDHAMSANECLGTVVPSLSNGQIDGCFIVNVNAQSWNSVRVRKLHADGNSVWNANGVVFNSPDIYNWTVAAQADPSGGLVVTNSTYNPTGIYAIRLDANGAFPWGENPAAVLIGNGQYSAITFGGGNCFVFALSDENETPSHLAYQQLNLATGTRLFSSNGQSLAGGVNGSCEEYRTIGMVGHRTAVVWNDHRYSNNITPIYYQILDSLGNPERTLNGERLIPLSTRPSQVSIQLCSDGNGGFFCGFVDRQSGLNVLKLTRVSGTGDRRGSEEGVPVDPNGREFLSFRIASDGAGGCYLCWMADLQVGFRRIFLMRMNADCQPMWNTPLTLSTEDIPAERALLALTSTTDSGCVAIWGDSENPPIYAAKVRGDVQDWTTVFCGACGIPYWFNDKVIPDTAGGVFVALTIDFDRTYAIVAQHLDSQGNTMWTPEGIEVCQVIRGSRLNNIIPSRNGSVYVLWSERGNEEMHMRGQRLAFNGEILWQQPGLTFMTALGNPEFVAAGTRDGNLLFTCTEVWANVRSIRGKHINTDGEPVDEWWADPLGGVISDTLLVTSPSMTCLDDQNISLVWQLGSSDEGSYGDLFAQMINTDDSPAIASRRESTVPFSYHLSQNFPNPFNPVTNISIALAKSGNVSLKVFNVLGQEVATLINHPMEVGEHTLVFDASELPSGIYLYRLEANGFRAQKKMILIK